MVGPSVWPWEPRAKVGWRSRSLEHGGWLDIFTWALMSREQQLWSRCPSLEWMMESGRSCVDDSEKRGRGVEKDGMEIQGQGFLHEGGYTGIKLMNTRVWSEKSRILGSLPPTAQLWLCGLHTGPISRSPSHLRMLKFSWGSYFRCLLLLWVFLITVLSLSGTSNIHTVTHFYHSLFIHLLFIFTITQLSRHKSPIPTCKHILKWFGDLGMGPAWSSHGHNCAMGGKLSRILLCSDHGAYQSESNVSKSLLGHYRFYKSISEVPSFQDVMEKVNLSAQLCVFY